MNAHVKTAHKGARWICKILQECLQDFVSKASLNRHIGRLHSGPMDKLVGRLKDRKRKAKMDLRETEYFGDDLTDGAKIAKIRRLEKENGKLKKENERLKKQIKNLIKTNK